VVVVREEQSTAGLQVGKRACLQRAGRGVARHHDAQRCGAGAQEPPDEVATGFVARLDAALAATATYFTVCTEGSASWGTEQVATGLKCRFGNR
jgi:hypothetical protein